MEHQLVIAGYVRNSDPSKKDSEVLNAQKEALRTHAREQYGIDIPSYLMYKDAISALKYPYWEREGLMKAWDDAENKRFDILLCTEFLGLLVKEMNKQQLSNTLSALMLKLFPLLRNLKIPLKVGFYMRFRVF